MVARNTMAGNGDHAARLPCFRLGQAQRGRGDTVWFRRIPLDGAAPSPVVMGLFNQWLGIFRDGSSEGIRADETGGLGWYRWPPDGGRGGRLGDTPVQGAGTTWSGSDIFLLRNFGELLKR